MHMQQEEKYREADTATKRTWFQPGSGIDNPVFVYDPAPPDVEETNTTDPEKEEEVNEIPEVTHHTEALVRICILPEPDLWTQGLQLKNGKGCVVCQVSHGSAAWRAGIKDGDYVVEVNGERMVGDKREHVLQKLCSTVNPALLLCQRPPHCSPLADWPLAIHSQLSALPLRPKLVHLKCGPEGYGFYLQELSTKMGQFIMDIEKDSPAERESLQNGDRLISVNDIPLEAPHPVIFPQSSQHKNRTADTRPRPHPATHAEVVQWIRLAGDCVTLLVVDPATDDLYQKIGVSPFSYQQQQRSNVQKC
uniref:Na(+)/H(+) exchange regulatory cofactor NHE-RF3-like isoform X3 n=1 Tax=Myxine glutinosa TaxID=7769 RepID=UPI00358ECBEA